MTRISKYSALLLIFFGICSAVFYENFIDLQFEANGRDEECFGFNVADKVKTLKFGLKSRRSINSEDIDVTLILPNSERIYHKFENFNFPRDENDVLTAGDYMMCFSTYKYELIHFQMEVDFKSDKEQGADSILMKLATELLSKLKLDFVGGAESFEKVTKSINEKLNTVEKQMSERRFAEHLDRSQAEKNFSDVNFWAGVQTVFMIISALCQVYFIRSLLTEGSKVGSFLRNRRIGHSY